MKKILSVLMCVMMIVAMMPAMAFAENRVANPQTDFIGAAEVTDIENPELTFALNFKISDVSESFTQDDLDFLVNNYGDWYTDYVLTISGLTQESVTFNYNDESADGYLGGQYDTYNTGWLYVPDGDVTVKKNERFYIMKYASEALEESGLRLTFKDVATFVKDFDCGIYFTREFIANNPDMVVNLELAVYSEEADEYISVTNKSFEAKDVIDAASVTDSEGKVTLYSTLKDAITEAEAGSTVKLLKDAAVDETIDITKNLTINGNGNTVTSTAKKVFTVNNTDEGTAESVTFQNITVVNSTASGRGIDTRGGVLTELVLDGVTIDTSAASGNNQALTIGGNSNKTATVTIKNNSNLDAGTSGYAVIVYNKVKMTVDKSTLKGYTAVYMKDDSSSAGSYESEVTIGNGSTLIGHKNEGESNAFGIVALEDGKVTVNISNTVISATGTGDYGVICYGNTNQGLVANCPDITLANGTNLSDIDIFVIKAGTTDNKPNITGGTYPVNPVTGAYVAEGTKVYLQSGKYYVGTAPVHSSGMNTWTKGADGIYTESYEAPYIPPTTTPTDNVTNETTNTSASGETTVTPTTNADVSASTTTTKTETGEVKAETKVDQTTADKIVEKAVENKSEEVVIDATTTAPTTGTTTTAPAEETKAAEVVIPTQTIEQIAEKTDADVTIKTDVAEIKLDNTAAAAIAEQAEGETVSIVAVKTDEVVVEEETEAGETKTVTEVHFELKVVSSDGNVIGDFNGGSVAVTVPVPKDMQTEELVCVYIDSNGLMHRVPGVKNANGTYTFTTTHFSSYAVMTAEEAEKAIAEQKAKVESVKLKLRSVNTKTSKGKKAIKLTASEVTDTGIDFDGYVIYRSTKKTSGFKKVFTTKTGTYYNTAIKSGTKYYYKAKGFVTIDGEKVYTDWSLKAIRTAK